MSPTDDSELRRRLARAVARVCPPWLAGSAEDIVQAAMMFTHLEVGLNRFFCTMVMTEEIKNGVRSADEVPGYLACKVRLCY